MSTPVVGSPGDNKAFVDGTAITFPVVLDSTHKQFKYDGTDYIAAEGTYVDLKQLAHAFNAALASAVRLDTVVVASKSTFVDGALRFTAAATGVNTKVFATGTTHDAIAKFGLTNGAALASGATGISTGVSFDSSLTTNQTPPSAVGVAGGSSHGPSAPSTVAGTNGVLSSALTWVKSADPSVLCQIVELIANSDSSVLSTSYFAPGAQAATIVATAVAQKARVTAVNGNGTATSALSSTFTPTAT